MASRAGRQRSGWSLNRQVASVCLAVPDQQVGVAAGRQRRMHDGVGLVLQRRAEDVACGNSVCPLRAGGDDGAGPCLVCCFAESDIGTAILGLPQQHGVQRVGVRPTTHDIEEGTLRSSSYRAKMGVIEGDFVEAAAGEVRVDAQASQSFQGILGA